MGVLAGLVGAPEVALVVDIDTLERSALAKIDRVMLLALEALAGSGIRVVLAARETTDRAALLQRVLLRAEVADGTQPDLVNKLRSSQAELRAVLLTDDPGLLSQVEPCDCGIALGRPELARANVVSIGDTAVRATLWWLAEEHARLIAT